MDNKITKNRISEFLSYDWLKSIFIILAVIIAWEFIYAFTSVKLTAGQDFKIFFDQNVLELDANGLKTKLKNNSVLSYDVLSIDDESFNSDQNLLSIRLEVEEGDILFTDNVVRPETSGGKTYDVVRAHTIVDNYGIYCFEDLLKDAKNYLKTYFLKDDATITYPIDKSNIADDKVESVFRQRMKGDNRFRSEEQILGGIDLEKQRVEKLIDDTNFFEYFLVNADKDIFLTYTKYTQLASFNPDRSDYQDLYNGEIALRGEGNKMTYGIDLGKLNGGDKNSSTLVKTTDAQGKLLGSAENVIMMVIDQKLYQEHLQYETISFFRYIIENYSNFQYNGW